METTMTAGRWIAAALLLAAGTALAAEEYPARSVRIFTSTPGNFHDIVARHLARALAERWGQPVVVENRGGAGATLAATATAQSPADGYTLLVSDRTGLTVSPTLMRNLAYDPFRDLAPISLLAAAPTILAAHSSVPAADMQQFVAYMRASPETHLASAGPATGSHLLGEVLKQVTGANVVNVQYKGTPAAMTALLAGETKAGFMLVPVALPHIKAGRVKAYATTGRNRFPGAPSIPTMAELGMGELESELWLALMAPARTPDATIAKVNRDVVELIKSPAMREALLVLGAEPMHSSPQELAAYMRSETAKWKKVIESAGVRLE
jgi:tripartite-type tricarboxylate transporter receptor subunit TctC